MQKSTASRSSDMDRRRLVTRICNTPGWIRLADLLQYVDRSRQAVAAMLASAAEAGLVVRRVSTGATYFAPPGTCPESLEAWLANEIGRAREQIKRLSAQIQADDHSITDVWVAQKPVHRITQAPPGVSIFGALCVTQTPTAKVALWETGHLMVQMSGASPVVFPPEVAAQIAQQLRGDSRIAA